MRKKKTFAAFFHVHSRRECNFAEKDRENGDIKDKIVNNLRSKCERM